MRCLRVLLVISVINYLAYLVYLNHDLSQISKSKKIPKYDACKAALILVDIRDTTLGKATLNDIYNRQSERLINNVNRLIDSAQNLTVPIIYTYNETTNWVVHLSDDSMQKDSLGVELNKRLRLGSDLFISKSKMDTFSMLDSLLRSYNINKLFVAGLDVANCINNTILTTSNRGYEVVVVDEALASETDLLKLEKLDDFRNHNIKIIALKDFK